MRKVAALVMVLSLAGWSLFDGETLATMASRADGGAQCGQVSRAEPLCPLC